MEETVPVEPEEAEEEAEKLNDDDLVASGTYGGLSWELNTEGYLRIDGGATMERQNSAAEYPWYAYKDSITGMGIYAVNVADHAFENYPNLANVDLHAGVLRSIGDYAFAGCTHLGWYEADWITTIGIGPYVESIGEGAFSGCSGIETLRFLGDAPDEIAANAFSGVNAEAGYPAGNTTWTADKRQSYGGNLTWEVWASGYYEGINWSLDGEYLYFYNSSAVMKEQSSAADYPWYAYKEYITHVQCYAKTVGAHALEGYTGLTWAYLGNTSMESVGDSAFAGCTGLESITFGKNIVSIGSKSFAGCTNIAFLTFNGNAPAIAADAFSGVTASVETPMGNETWTDAVKQNYGGNLSWVLQKGGYYGALSWNLSDGFLMIEGGSAMTEQASAAGYPWYAFKDEIVSVYINASNVGAHALEGYPKMQVVSFGSDVQEIGSKAVANCPVLHSVSFEGNAPVIAADAFAGDNTGAAYPLYDDTWTTQKRQNYGGTIEWYWSTSGSYGRDVYWDLYNGNLSVYNYEDSPIPDAASAADYPWYAHKDSITFVYISAQNVPAHMVEGYPKVADVYLNPDVTEVGTKAFANCAKLTEIRFNGNAPAIASDAFTGVTATVIYPTDDATWTDAVKQNYGGNLTWQEPHRIIEEGTYGGVEWYFTNQNVLVIMGDSMPNNASAASYPWNKYANKAEILYVEGSNIGNYCFAGFSKLEIVEMYEVKSIGSNAFRNCSALSAVYFIADEATPTIASNAFSGVTAKAYYYGTAIESIINKNYGGRLTWERYADCSIGHTYEAAVTKPTCAEQGYTTYTCAICGYSFVDEYVPATGIHAYDDHKDTDCNVCGQTRTVVPGVIPVYRLYNPYTHEHLLTGGEVEKTALLAAGWSLDGVAWSAPENGTPVYRLYNPYDDWHTYTVDVNEKNAMEAVGWTVDGVISCSAPASGRPIYRLFNPYVQSNFHLFTAGAEERDMLVAAGWILEGIAWRALA